MNLLFVCNQGQHRSRTAAELFGGRHRGLYGNELTDRDLRWADLVFVMEEHQRRTIGERFPDLYLQKTIISLDVPDVYSYGQSGLIDALKRRMSALQPDLELR